MERLRKISVVLISFISVVPLFLMAQNDPKDYLKVHNSARADVGVQPLKWDKWLEECAREFVTKRAATCTVGRGHAGRFGRLTARNMGFITGAGAVAVWVKTKEKYDYNSNSCIGKVSSCKPYVQVVWNKTTSVGCARVRCHDYKKGVFISCYYNPPHNFPAERPYILPELRN